jgi:biopolymer transport protein ExbD
MNGNWLVRPEGAPTASALPSAEAVLAGLRDGVYVPTDEVKGPADRDWVAIEAHPRFEEACIDLEGSAPEHPDETHLDMNPLIDVCLVLLIFFILTITYESLRRSLAIPQSVEEEKGTPTKVEFAEIKDRVFRVTARMNGDQVVIKVEDRTVSQEKVQEEIERVMKTTGKREMILDVDGHVPWGTQTALLDAAKGANVRNILYRPH